MLIMKDGKVGPAHLKIASSPSYTLTEIEKLAANFADNNDASADLDAPDAIKLRMFLGAFVAYLARREREGRDEQR